MKKKIVYLFCLLSATAYGQSKIKDGTIASALTPVADAILELESNKKGLLLPRVSLTATNDPSPMISHIEGMTVYNLVTSGTSPNDVSPGYYYNDGTQWVKLTSQKVDLRFVGANNHITMDAGQGANGSSAGTGSYNIGIGQNSLLNNTTGLANVAIGYNSLATNTTGSGNVAIGGVGLSPLGSLGKNTTGNNNIGISDALIGNTTGRHNIGMGYGSLYVNEVGVENIGIGPYSLNHFQGSGSNTIVGNGNIGLGARALLELASGKNNIGIGNWAGLGHTAGDGNIFIGRQVNSAVSSSASNQLNIGNWIYGDNGKIGIAQPLPHSTLQVSGSVAANVVVITANYTIKDDDYTVISRAASPITVTLPDPATCKGRMYYIINNGSDQITTSAAFEVATGQTQNFIPKSLIGISSPNPNIGGKYLLQSDGTTWVLINLG